MTQTLSCFSICGAVVFSMISSMLVAEPNRVEFPKDVESLVHYTTVTRGDITEHMLTSQAALDAVREGKDMPDGTQVILADYRDGAIYRYFVMQKGENWGAEYPSYRRTRDWQFQWYWPDGSINQNENTERCQSCHQGRSQTHYLFTYGDLQDYLNQH